MSSITKRRLRDGGAALARSDTDLKAISDPELRSLRDLVLDGACAMQSLDDLGSAEANEAAWLDYLALDRFLKEIDAEITQRNTLSIRDENVMSPCGCKLLLFKGKDEKFRPILIADPDSVWCADHGWVRVDESTFKVFGAVERVYPESKP